MSAPVSVETDDGGRPVLAGIVISNRIRTKLAPASHGMLTKPKMSSHAKVHGASAAHDEPWPGNNCSWM